MGKKKKEITGSTWNVTTGCTKVSEACRNCYAEKMALRLKAMGQEKYRNGFMLTLHPSTLDTPYRWKKPRIIFVNSMSDMFHEDIPVDYIRKVFAVMNNNPHHIFQIVTKRSHLLQKYDHDSLINWTPNIWMGVTVENRDAIKRVAHLKQTGARIKFLCCEPLLEPLPFLDLDGIDWVIAGGESGYNARPMKKEWVKDILGQCRSSNTHFYFKQWGGISKNMGGRELDGRTYTEMPPIHSATIWRD